MKIERCPTCRRKHTRSQPQNAIYWLLLHLIAEQIRPGGLSYSAEQWHTYCKSRWLGCEEVTLPNGKVHLLLPDSHSLDVAEFGDYLDKVQAWAAERGVWLADLEAA